MVPCQITLPARLDQRRLLDEPATLGLPLASSGGPGRGTGKEHSEREGER